MAEPPTIQTFCFQVPAGAPIFNVGETGDFLSFGSKNAGFVVAVASSWVEGIIGMESPCNKCPPPWIQWIQWSLWK